ncbi:MAG TPA: Mur ligase family protein [Thermoanaerobaculaceae bacterium]|nr:Mur ligase family protein [Thermoanaerobaculaceae bacterium]
MSFPHALAAGAEALLAPRLEQRILPGLERMQRALDALGRPERAFTSVLVLGTNGKGSTAALLAGILRAHGVRVGLYTSPHLIAVEERIQTDGAKIARGRLAEVVAGLNTFPDLSYFEALTCAAILEFAERKVDVAVMEAGLGGRWDASNAVDPAVALLTNVGTDHQRWLGETRTAIAAEKAAALRGRAAIVGSWDPEVEPVIRVSADPRTPLSLASEWATVRADSSQLTADSPVPNPEREGERTGSCELSAVSCQLTARQRVSIRVGQVAGTVMLPLAGRHQIANLELALAGAAALARHGLAPAPSADAVRRGIEGVSWPGRLQWCTFGGHRLLLDGAHNHEAIAALACALDDIGLSGKLHLLFSCLDDKPLESMAALLRPRVVDVTVAPVRSPRARPLDDLAAAFPGCRRAPSVSAALLDLPAELPTLVTGSLRFVGEVLAGIGETDG